MFTSPKSILFSIGNINIYFYGVIMGLAILFGIIAISFIAKKYYKNINIDLLYDLFFYVILGGILGARIYYVLLGFDYYSRHILEAFLIMQGGLSIHGAIIGGCIAGAIFCKIKKISFLEYADIFAFGLPLGQAIGRWGNFFNSEAFGKPTSLPWKLYIPEMKRPLEYYDYSYFHPTFLYECILDIIIFCILFFVIRKISKEKKGVIFFSYLILYSLVRIFVEYIRIDSALNIFGIPVAQIISVILILLSIIYLKKIYTKKA